MPLTYCFAGSDIKAWWHVAFWERSGAPSRPPVHLHNIATCHMETGITNLCLSLVALPPRLLLQTLVLLMSLPLFYFVLSFVLLFYHSVAPGFITWRLFCWVVILGKRKQHFAQRQRKTHTLEASGMLWGSGDCMSTPAVRIAVAERRANTNVINTSAFAWGTLCVSEFGWWLFKYAVSQALVPRGSEAKVLSHFF